MITIDGLITGIDTETIIAGLLDIQQTQIDRLQIRRQGLEARKTAYESLEVQLVSFQVTANQLARTTGDVFNARNVVVSDESSLFAVANTKATVGTYQIHIDALARAHQVVSAGFAAPDAEITQGTLDIQAGAEGPVTITIDETNNTVQGLVDAINGADVGLSATIVNDGSSGGTPYRVLLTSNETGVENAMTISNYLVASHGNATQPTFDLATPVQAAADASVRLGAGPGALVVQHATNEIDSLIQGVTLNLLSADANKELIVRVEANPAPATTAINDLVDSYNSIMDFVDELVRFNPETDEAGLLIGDRTVTDIQNELRAAMLDVVPNSRGSANRISSLGITVNNRGRLTINDTRLQEVLAGRVAGIDSTDIKNMFANVDNDVPAGIASRISRLVDGYLDFEVGDISAVKVQLSDQLNSLDDSIDRQQLLFDTQQQDLISQFTALESAISELQTTSSFLSSQLANVGKIGRST